MHIMPKFKDKWESPGLNGVILLCTPERASTLRGYHLMLLFGRILELNFFNITLSTF